MSYYNTSRSFPPGQAVDRVRGVKLPAESPQLTHWRKLSPVRTGLFGSSSQDLDKTLIVTTATLFSFREGSKRKRGHQKEGPSRSENRVDFIQFVFFLFAV